MNIPEFSLERFQSLYEHHVDFNLSESGVHPLTVRDLLTEDEIDAFLDTRLIYEQTNGPQQLRENISLLYEGSNADNVLVTSGTIEANFVTFISLLSAGDEFVYMLPNYQQFKGMAETFGVNLKPFYLQEEHGWQPDLDALTATITDKTKVIALCNPNNPTGVLLSDEARAHIINLASKVGAWLVVDEIYRGSEHNGQLTPSFWGCYDKVIVTSGLSKAFGLPGLRIGWLVAPEHITDRAWGVKDYTSITAATLSYDLATRALTPALRSKIWGRNINLVKQNLALLANWVNEQAGLFSLTVPDAAAMAFVKYHADIASETLADRLHKQQSVLVVPGVHFGLEHFVRIGYGLETEKLEAALARIAEEVKGLELVPH